MEQIKKKCLKILIDNSGYELKNHGDLAMLQVASERFKQHFPDAEIYIFTNAPDRLKKLIPYAIPASLAGRKQWDAQWNIIGSLHKLFPKSFYSWLDSREVFFKLKYHNFSRRWIEQRLSKRGYDMQPMHTYLALVQQADIVIATGGGYITDTFERHALCVLKTLALAQAFGKPTALFGQGIGPLNNQKLLNFAKQVLPKLCQLSLREAVFSKHLALYVGVPENLIAITGDDAVTLAYSKAPLKLGRDIGVNLRIASYSGIKEDVLNGIRYNMNLASKMFDAKLIPIPISVHEGDSDIESLRMLLSDYDVDNTKLLDTPQKVIEQISLCRIVITGSYHAAVFALSQGISVVAIAASDYYRYKFEGLADQFGCACLIVDQDSSTFSNDMKKIINSSWQNADEVRIGLLEQAKIQVHKSELAYDVFMTKKIKK